MLRLFQHSGASIEHIKKLSNKLLRLCCFSTNILLLNSTDFVLKDLYLFINTVAMVGFEKTIYEVDEGRMEALCVKVVNASRSNCLVNFPFNISFTMVDMSAGNSYMQQLNSRP